MVYIPQRKHQTWLSLLTVDNKQPFNILKTVTTASSTYYMPHIIHPLSIISHMS